MARTDRSRSWRKVVAVVVVGVLIVVVGAYWYARPLLLTGTGYAAHNQCAVVHVADRDDPTRDLPANPLIPYLQSSESEAGANSAVLGVLSRQRAWHTEGFGCTLADRRPDLGEPPATIQRPHPFTDAPTPTPDAGVTAAVDRAFGDHLPDAESDALGTRAIVVVQDGRIVAERYAEGFGADTRHLGWSMSKSVTNLLVGRLVAEGHLALDDGRWQGRELLPPGWLAESTTVLASAGTVEGYGAGWHANRLPGGSLRDQRLPADTYWASGHDGQRLYVVPSADLVVVRLGLTADDSMADQLVAELASR